jgi:hypothetical protein
VEIHAGPLASQLRGDCQLAQCSVTGEVVMIYDPSDFYDDGRQCTSDFCGPDGPRNEPLVNGTTCPVTPAGRCWEGGCVDCVDGDPSMQNCPSGKACDGFVCVPLHCVNNNQADYALGETDVNCGGPCRRCPEGDACLQAADCDSGVCAMSTCQIPTCSDDVHNDAETGVDCGAPSCPLCGSGDGCQTGADCASGVCWAGACEMPTCFDGIRNDGEAGIDCGGPCDPCP